MQKPYQCPVCGKENVTLLCGGCGFDGSRDYNKYPTLQRVPRNAKEILPGSAGKSFTNNEHNAGVAYGPTNGGFVVAGALHQGSSGHKADGEATHNNWRQCEITAPGVTSKEEIVRSNHGLQMPASIERGFSVADELRKFKELLDMGVLTQVEFNAKKRELLGGGVPTYSKTSNVPKQPTIVHLTISRPNQFFVWNPAMKITVDGVPQADLCNNSSISVATMPGRHTIDICFAFRRTVVQVELVADSTVIACFNRITGKIDVKAIGNVPIYMKQHS